MSAPLIIVSNGRQGPFFFGTDEGVQITAPAIEMRSMQDARHSPTPTNLRAVAAGYGVRIRESLVCARCARVGAGWF